MKVGLGRCGGARVCQKAALCVTLGTLPGLLAPQGFWGPREGGRGGRDSVGGTAGGGGGLKNGSGGEEWCRKDGCYFFFLYSVVEMAG